MYRNINSELTQCYRSNRLQFKTKRLTSSTMIVYFSISFYSSISSWFLHLEHCCYVYVWLELLFIFLPNKTFNHYVKKNWIMWKKYVSDHRNTTNAPYKLNWILVQRARDSATIYREFGFLYVNVYNCGDIRITSLLTARPFDTKWDADYWLYSVFFFTASLKEGWLKADGLKGGSKVYYHWLSGPHLCISSLWGCVSATCPCVWAFLLTTTCCHNKGAQGRKAFHKQPKCAWLSGQHQGGSDGTAGWWAAPPCGDFQYLCVRGSVRALFSGSRVWVVGEGCLCTQAV